MERHGEAIQVVNERMVVRKNGPHLPRRQRPIPSSAPRVLLAGEGQHGLLSRLLHLSSHGPHHVRQNDGLGALGRALGCVRGEVHVVQLGHCRGHALLRRVMGGALLVTGGYTWGVAGQWWWRGQLI